MFRVGKSKTRELECIFRGQRNIFMYLHISNKISEQIKKGQ